MILKIFVWTLLGTILGILEFWNFFDFFVKIRRLDPPWNTGQKKFFEKITLKHLQNTFGHFWERFWAFLEFWNFFDFFENFRLDTFGDDFGHFWNFENFLIFFAKFRRLDPPWNTGQKFFSRKSPQNMFKTRLDTFGNDLGFFGILKNFLLWKFSFGLFWGRFWAFLNFETFLIFLKIFEDSTLHGTLGKKFSRKNHPKTTSKHVWTLLGTILGMFVILNFFLILKIFVWTLDFGHFWNFETFLIFFKIFEDSTLHGTLGKKFFRKITLKHLQNTFGHFWDEFGHFWNFENFSIFLKIFEDSTLHGTLGKNFFRKKTPSNIFKTRLDTFGNEFGHFWNFENFFDFENFRLDTFGDDFGHFWIFETFLIFLKKFEDSTLHGTLGKNFFRKNYPKTSSKHVWTLLGTILGILEFWKFFDFFENFQ